MLPEQQQPASKAGGVRIAARLRDCGSREPKRCSAQVEGASATADGSEPHGCVSNEIRLLT